MLDADGNEITDETHIGNLNPFRYRGYYYDTETELYYLKSRYYDPKIGRFITIDDHTYLDPDTVNGVNLYAYCGNNPVMNTDPTGHFPLMLLLGGLVFGAIAGAAVNTGMQLVKNGGDWSSLDRGSILNSALVGGALGLSLALGVAYLGPVIAGAAGASAKTALMAFGTSTAISFGAGALGYASEQWLNGREASFGTAMMNGGFVALESMINFGTGGIIGSVGDVGTKGKFFVSKEWWLKLILGQEITQPFKVGIDLIRKNI